jgi:phosphoribosylanthranilate isomerase
MSIRIKICGITSSDDAHAVSACGADYIGIIVNIAGSPRSVSTAQAAAICSGIESTVLLMEGPLSCIDATVKRLRPSAIQLIGNFGSSDIERLKQHADTQIWMSIPVARTGKACVGDIAQRVSLLQKSGLDAIVLDTLVPGHKGGTGLTCDWNLAAQIVQSVTLPVFLAGGLTHDNVAGAAAAVRPFGVDVSSGVEIRPGTKDIEKVKRFIQRSLSAMDSLQPSS